MIVPVRRTALVAGLFFLGACADAPVVAPDLPVDVAASRGPLKSLPSIGEIAVAAATDPVPANREFTQLVAALQYVDAEEQTQLVDLFVNGKGQRTVFAPTDAAFGRLYALASDLLGTPIDAITDLPSDLVLQVLLYHVTTGRRGANSVVPPQDVRTIETLGGSAFQVTPEGEIRDALMAAEVPNARIVTADIQASNGVVHVIDQVLLPPSVVAALLPPAMP